MQIVAISDIHEISREWKYLLDNSVHKNYEVAVYVTGRSSFPDMLDGIPVINYLQFSSLYNKGIISKFILPRERFYDQSKLISDLKILGVERKDILLTENINNFSAQNLDEILDYDSAPYLPYLEFHIVDQCNLNCKGCEHYSGLVKHSHFHNDKNIYRDLQQLKQFITDIGKIRILGGEPLLHPNIERILQFTREVYPQSDIHIVTNGILKHMPKTFFSTCKRNNIYLYISYYPPMIGKMNEIKTILEANEIEYHITSLMSSFRIKYTLNKQVDVETIFDNCPQAHCYNLYEGKIGACFLPFTTKYFNEYFNLNLPTNEAIDLYDKTLTTKKLKTYLQTPIERCH